MTPEQQTIIDMCKHVNTGMATTHGGQRGPGSHPPVAGVARKKLPPLKPIRLMDDTPRFANLRDGGNLEPPRVYFTAIFWVVLGAFLTMCWIGGALIEAATFPDLTEIIELK